MKAIFFTFFFILNLWANERIVSLSPSITEILYALGADKEIVATSSYSLYPKEATKLPIVGGYTNPSIEKILMQKPSLVIGQSFNEQTLQKLHYFHIKTLKIQLKTIKDIQDSISILGATLKKKNQAKQLTTNITNAIIQTKKSTHPHTVMIVYGLQEDLRSGIYIAGTHIFFNDIIILSGNINSYTNTAIEQPVLNYENVIALNPEQIIILHSHATQPNVNVQKALQNWYKIPTKASQNKHITVIDEEYLHIPSQRVALTIKKLIKEMQYD